jgi:hypothetical protein
MTNNDAAVIRGSRMSNEIPRKTYTAFSGGFHSVRLALEKYFELKEKEVTNRGHINCETGELRWDRHK